MWMEFIAGASQLYSRATLMSDRLNVEVARAALDWDQHLNVRLIADQVVKPKRGLGMRKLCAKLIPERFSHEQKQSVYFPGTVGL